MDTPTTPIAARLLVLEGEAWLRHDGERQPLGTGSFLASGDVVETGPAGEIHVLLASGHVLALGPDQLLSLDADVLATPVADSSEWRCAVPAGLDLLMDGPALALDTVLESPQALDHLLGPGDTSSASPDYPGLLAFDDPGLGHLLRSLFGPEAH